MSTPVTNTQCCISSAATVISDDSASRCHGGATASASDSEGLALRHQAARHKRVSVMSQHCIVMAALQLVSATAQPELQWRRSGVAVAAWQL